MLPIPPQRSRALRSPELRYGRAELTRSAAPNAPPTRRQGHALRAAWTSALLLATGCPVLLDDDFSTLPHEEVSGGSGGRPALADGASAATAAGGTPAGPSGEAGAGSAGSMNPGSSGVPSSSGASGGGSSSVGSNGGGPNAGGSGSDVPSLGGSSGAASSAGGSNEPASCADGTALGPNGHCYRLGTASSPWLGARSQCRSIGDGWDLATVLDERDSAFVSTLLSTDAWIGADDTNGMGVWRWVRDSAEFWQGGSSGSALNDAYVNWNDDEPRSGGGKNCLRISPSALWATADCSSGFPSLCEGPSD